MDFLAISGSARLASTNTAMLRQLAVAAGPAHRITVFDGIGDLPVFSPDLERGPLPAPVAGLAHAIAQADGLIIASPEYVHAIPGGLKNAIDWLVSRDEVIGKPIALIHGSHRGDDMLGQLRLVLGTISDRFAPDLFLRLDLLKKTPDQIAATLADPGPRADIADFLNRFADHCGTPRW